jgi:hypothetical protein
VWQTEGPLHEKVVAAGDAAANGGRRSGRARGSKGCLTRRAAKAQPKHTGDKDRRRYGGKTKAGSKADAAGREPTLAEGRKNRALWLQPQRTRVTTNLSLNTKHFLPPASAAVASWWRGCGLSFTLPSHRDIIFTSTSNSIDRQVGIRSWIER